MAITAKRRNPQDATLRNIRALKARIEALGDRVFGLEVIVFGLSPRVERRKLKATRKRRP